MSCVFDGAPGGSAVWNPFNLIFLFETDVILNLFETDIILNSLGKTCIENATR